MCDSDTDDTSEAMVLLEYVNAVDNQRVRIEASPYNGEDAEFDDEWEVKTKLRYPDEDNWDTVHTDYSRGRPEFPNKSLLEQ